MKVDYLLVGQGISGTWLSYFLLQENKTILVIDDKDPNAPSRLAAGIINPVTGRRHVSTWMIDSLLPYVWDNYTRLGQLLGINAISQKNVTDFFPSPQMRESFIKRVEEKGDYVSEPETPNQFLPLFNYEFGCGEIKPVFTAHLESIIPAWRNKLETDNLIRNEKLELSELIIEKDHIRYRDIEAGKIIFCDGAVCSQNPWFQLLPFAPNKGEALFLHIPDLPKDRIYKKGMLLVPMVQPDQWWLGSAYEWEFKDALPSADFRNKAEQLLNQWLKLPYTIQDHIASIRPATIERRPFVGLHPLHPAIAILNGMGTKGCSLAPFFAEQLTRFLVHGSPIHPEGDVKRFTRILSRNIA